jgi:hypothetical protein
MWELTSIWQSLKQGDILVPHQHNYHVKELETNTHKKQLLEACTRVMTVLESGQLQR